MGSFSMCIGCWIGIVSMGFLGHIKVMVVTGAVASVVSIQTSGAIWVGRLVVLFCISAKSTWRLCLSCSLHIEQLCMLVD